MGNVMTPTFKPGDRVKLRDVSFWPEKIRGEHIGKVVSRDDFAAKIRSIVGFHVPERHALSDASDEVYVVFTIRGEELPTWFPASRLSLAAPNPDERSQTSEEAHADKTKRPKSLIWLWPVPISLLLGPIVLAPLLRSPGDPTGEFTGAGAGGMLGLALALICRILGCFVFPAVASDRDKTRFPA